eukprot:779955-Pleurochrysis_carterae.AAC.3
MLRIHTLNSAAITALEHPAAAAAAASGDNGIADADAGTGADASRIEAAPAGSAAIASWDGTPHHQAAQARMISCRASAVISVSRLIECG